MTKTKARQEQLLQLLSNMGVGVINISNDKLAALMGVSKKTIQRDLNQLSNEELIIKETSLIRSNGETRKQRDIILKDEPQRRFTLDQHRQLSNKDNHEIFTTEWNEVIWNRKVDGQWQRHFSDKEFRDEKQAYHWLYTALAHHHKKAIEGDTYTNRGSI